MNFEDILNEYLYIGEIDSVFPIERFSCNISVRVSQSLDNIDEIICGILNCHQGLTDFSTLGDVLGFSVYDNSQSRKYRDMAEVHLMNYLLKEREEFYLINVGGSPTNPTIELTEQGTVSLTTGLKYKYYSGRFIGYSIKKIQGINEAEALQSCDILPEITSLHRVKINDVDNACFLNHELYQSIQQLCIKVPEFQNADLQSFTEPASYADFSQRIVYKLYTHEGINNEVVIAYRGDKLLVHISECINEAVNRYVKSGIVREIVFSAIWSNPETIYDSNLLMRYLDKWDWDTLLDKNVKWNDPEVWNLFDTHCNNRIWKKLSGVSPINLVIEQLDKRTEKWDWTLLSERLPDEFILNNIIKFHFRWDFEVLSQKHLSFVRSAMLAIQEYNHNNGEQDIKPSWNFYDITESLDDDFLIHAISSGAIVNYPNLSLKPYSLISEVFNRKFDVFANWNYKLFSEEWEIDQILQEEKIEQYIHWYIVLTRICSDSQLVDRYLKSGKFNEIITRNRNEIKSFTTEKLEWNEWLIDFFDSKSLILWQTTYRHQGFDVNQHIAWNEELLQKYINKFTTPEGKTFLSTKIQSIEFIKRNSEFDYDWVAILEGLETNEQLRKQLTADILYNFRDKLPWNEICGKIRNETFLKRNVLKFIDYFDFQVLSHRSPQLLKQLLSMPEVVGQSWDWTTVTQTIDEDFILNHFCEYPWDFAVLSKKSANFVEQALVIEGNYSLLWKWDLLAETLHDTSIVSILPELNNKYGSIQPEQMKCFWFYVTKRLDRNFLIIHAADFSFNWDWTFITRDLFSKEEILHSSNEVLGYWDWIYLIENKIGFDELVEKSLFKLLQAAQRLIADDATRQNVITLLTKKLLHKPDLLEYWMNEESNNPSIINLDWDLLSNHNQFYYNDYFLEKYTSFWNWDLISNQKNLFRLVDESGTFQTYLRDGIKKRLTNKLLNWNWAILSRNDSLIKNFGILSDKRFINKWDWQYISEYGKFIDPNKHYSEVSRRYIQLQDFIDWRLLSRRKDIKFSKELLTAFQNKNWDWELLSESYVLDIDNDFLVQMQSYPWNWKALSKNKRINLGLPKTSNDVSANQSILIALKDKDWDWAYLSERKDLEVNYSLIEETKEKPWNFKLLTKHFLSDNLLLENYLKLLFEEDLDWEMLSSSSKPMFTTDFVKQYNDYWEWTALSNNNSIQLNEELIRSFEYWNYGVLTKRKEVIENPHWIFMLKNKDWDWNYISSSDKYDLDEEFIDKFDDHLNFSLLSSNQSVKFTPAILKKYFRKWDYNSLESNYSITRDDILKACVKNILSENASLKFVQKIDAINSAWKGYIYHFTHLTNAATIINTKKILSRNNAHKTGFSNSAGLVVENRNDAHNFARFYFRPQTPTQFYNESLGVDSSSGFLKQWRFYNGERWVSNSKWKSHYPTAQKLGLPRCPVPVFFRFNLNEVLEKVENSCCVSNGNMQTGWAEYGTINQMIDRFNFDDLYSSIGNTRNDDWRDYITYSQQEFLINNEFDFSSLSSIEIFVPDESSKKALLNLIEVGNELTQRIFIDDYKSSLYHRKNRMVRVTYEKDILEITTDYRDKHSLLVEFDGDYSKFAKEIVGNVTFVSSNALRGETHLKAVISNVIHFKVKFIDELNREWIVYQTNCENSKFTVCDEKKVGDEVLSGIREAERHVRELIATAPELHEFFRMKVRHYVLFDHTVLVYNQYLKYPWPLKSKNYNQLFKTFLILHDIGKPTADATGKKENQYQCTRNILIQIWDKTPFATDDLEIALSLASGDVIGEYFQGIRNTYETTSELGRLAKKAGIGLESFFELYFVYYQCDVASYTQDANGFAFLEHLFEYEDGSKVFDLKEGCLRFSNKYHEKYLKLKKHITAWR